MAARLIDELIAGGVTVEVTALTEGELSAAGKEGGGLAALCRARGARAAIRTEPSRRAVRLWMTDGSSRGVDDTIQAEPSSDPEAAARGLALRVVEVLRPRLAAPEVTEPPSASASAPPPAASASASVPVASATIQGLPPPPPPLPPPVQKPVPWPDSLTIYVSPAILLRPATPISPGAGGLWGFTKMVTPYLGIDLAAIVPVAAAELTTPEGRVKIASGAVGATLWARYPARPSTVHVWGGVGAAAGFLGYDAEAATTAVRASDGVVAHVLPNVRAALEWRAWPSLGFRADGIVAIARPRPILEVAGQPDIALEEPLLGLAAGVVVWLP